jgi:hypothetical protein
LFVKSFSIQLEELTGKLERLKFPSPYRAVDLDVSATQGGARKATLPLG